MSNQYNFPDQRQRIFNINPFPNPQVFHTGQHMQIESMTNQSKLFQIEDEQIDNTVFSKIIDIRSTLINTFKQIDVQQIAELIKQFQNSKDIITLFIKNNYKEFQDTIEQLQQYIQNFNTYQDFSPQDFKVIVNQIQKMQQLSDPIQFFQQYSSNTEIINRLQLYLNFKDTIKEIIQIAQIIQERPDNYMFFIFMEQQNTYNTNQIQSNIFSEEEFFDLIKHFNQYFDMRGEKKRIFFNENIDLEYQMNEFNEIFYILQTQTDEPQQTYGLIHLYKEQNNSIQRRIIGHLKARQQLLQKINNIQKQENLHSSFSTFEYIQKTLLIDLLKINNQFQNLLKPLREYLISTKRLQIIDYFLFDLIVNKQNNGNLQQNKY